MQVHLCFNVPNSAVRNGPSVVYAVAVNCLYKDRVRDRDRVSGRVTDRVRFRV